MDRPVDRQLSVVRIEHWIAPEQSGAEQSGVASRWSADDDNFET